MSNFPSRPQTPPALGLVNGQLLTPPPTAKPSRAVRFALDEGTPSKPKRRFQSFKGDVESAVAEYAELEDLRDFSDGSQDISVLTESPTDSSLPSPTQSPASSQSSISIEKDAALVDVTGDFDTPIVTEPFPFLRLPLSIRKRVYEILLVVPGLICVRQNHTSYHNEDKAFLYAEDRQLLPGISYALPQLTVDGFKIRFPRFRYANVAILGVSKEVCAESKAVMYGGNDFEIVCPNTELSPVPDYKIPLFPRGYQRLVLSLSIRVRALYPLKWLLNGGFAELKSAYRGLETLTIIFEIENGAKGVGKALGKKVGENWVAYVKRIHAVMAVDLFAGNKHTKHLPTWISLRVLFNGEAYDDTAELDTHNISVDSSTGFISIPDIAEERLRRYHLKRGLPEAFELFKKGCR
ncbi:hypothetical protein N0V90_005620 [Kalmusia sp. IMI 367209]|nr:hypothetical protein N0V90_005620 [Kalmusia sp. IMI 367209]